MGLFWRRRQIKDASRIVNGSFSSIACCRRENAGKVRTLAPHLWTHAHPETRPPRQASRGKGGNLRQTRGLQLRSRIWRKQAPQARIHHPRRDRVKRRTLVSIGGVQSNHTRMVAAVAVKIGMKCLLVQESWVPHEDAVHDRVGNILLSRIMGAEVGLVDEGFDIGVRPSWEKALYEVKASGGRPYAIPAGASVHPSGGLGYVGFAEEVRARRNSLGLASTCTVTGSTHAGMLVGFSKDGRQRNVLGIEASAHPRPNQGASAKHCPAYCKGRRAWHGNRRRRRGVARGVRVPDGIPSEETKDAIRLCARLEGMITDPVYEGKSLQGDDRPRPEGPLSGRVKDPLRASRRSAGDKRLWLRLFAMADARQSKYLFY